MAFLHALILLVIAPQVFMLELTVLNQCDETIWLATTPNFGEEPLPGGQSIKEDQGQTHVYTVKHFNQKTFKSNSANLDEFANALLFIHVS